MGSAAGLQVNRKICGFYKDEHDDWVATLECHHGQHVRNNPPFTNRPWVESAEGRADKLGVELDCVRCDRFEFPNGLEFYKKTPEFDESSIPAGLLKEHATKTGTWGLIKVREGQLRYTAGQHQQTLDESGTGIVVPNMLHSVAPVDHVRFCVEFYRKENV
jgi:tellurite methyltransferase